METGLFEIQANHLTEVKRSQIHSASQEVNYALFPRAGAVDVYRDPAVRGVTN
jgi:hypothetical protein